MKKKYYLEPERKFIVDNVMPEVNKVININCSIIKSPLILTNNESDLIMSELSFTKINNKGQNSEISFENISREKPIYIDNLVCIYF